MCGINHNANPAMNMFNNNAAAKPGLLGGNANPAGNMLGGLLGGNANPAGNILGGLLGGKADAAQGVIGVVTQIVGLLVNALQGGQTGQAQQGPLGQPQNAMPQGPFGQAGNAGPFGQPQNTFAQPAPFGQPQQGVFGGPVAFNPGMNMVGNPMATSPVMPMIGTPNTNPFGPMPGNMFGQQQMMMNILMAIVTTMIQALQAGNTAPNQNPNAPIAGNQGPQGGAINNQNNNGGVNQNVIVNGNNNGVIAQNVNGNNFGQGNTLFPPFLNEQDRKVQDIVNDKKGQWLVGHGHYKKDGNQFNITKGDMKGYTVQHVDGNKYNVMNPQGQNIAQYEGKKPNKIASPVAFDLNGDGKIGTTGATTAKDRLAGTELGATRQFDIDNNGTLDTVEWMTGDGDALLTDENGVLFGDEGGKYDNGYEKLALRDADKDGQLTGAELNGLQLWVDNGDAIQSADEMVSATDAGVSRISVDMNLVANERGENLMRADATINGQNVMSEDVWFGKA